MPLFVCSKLLRNNKAKNDENSLKIGATSVTSEKKNLAFLWDHSRDMTIPVVELQRFFRGKINKGRKVLDAVVTEWNVRKNEAIAVSGMGN